MKRGGTVSGAVSLVMIFCVLCMAVFAALTMITAQREHTLAVLTADRAEAYYDADRTAAEIVAALKQGEKPQGVTLEGDTASFAVPAGGDILLAVKVRMEDQGCTVEQWQTVYAGEWEMDETIDVWGGGE